MTWFRDYLPEEVLVLDTSAILNIFGCGAPNDVLSSLRCPSWVEETALREIQRHPVPSLCHLSAIQAHVVAQHLCRVKMSPDEYATFLEMAQGTLGSRLDEGESATLAVASARGASVVIDENKGRRYAAENFPDVNVVSSLKLFVSAAVRLGRDEAYARVLIESAISNARMGVPRVEHALLEVILR